VHADKEPEPLNLGVPVVDFPRANAILARAQALLWVRDWGFPLSVTRHTVIGLKLVKCVLARVLGVIHSLLVYHKPYMRETTQKNLLIPQM
jgi:hypothetical protein